VSEVATPAGASTLGRYKDLACPTAIKCAFGFIGVFPRLSNLLTDARPSSLPQHPCAVPTLKMRNAATLPKG
jgi:hypothetical protein